MVPSRRGFSLLEMLIVMVIVAGLAIFSLPRFGGLRDRSRMTAARQEIEAGIATARAAAIQKGRTARFRLAAGFLTVTVDTTAGGAQKTLIARHSLDSLHGVTTSATDTMITFDPRGFAQPRLAATGIFRVLGTGRRDSVCVTPAGQIMPRRCSL
jgi:prepilin-type N-terminal cleavage/methylation domain-containing protein